MLKAGQSLGKRWNTGFLLTTALVVAIDQLSKTWIRLSLAPGQSLPLTGFFRFTRVHNTGSAFGLFQNQSLPLTIFAIISIIALLVFVFFFAHRLQFSQSWTSYLGLGLLLGGSIGNLTDRFNLGYITDFIDIGIWPSFNIADSALVVGVILLAYSILFLGTPRTDQPA